MFSQATLSFVNNTVAMSETEMAARRLKLSRCHIKIIFISGTIKILLNWLNESVNLSTVSDESDSESGTDMFTSDEMYQCLGIILWSHTSGLLLD